MSETTSGESTEGSASILVEANVQTVSEATPENRAAVAAQTATETLAFQDVLQGMHSDACALGVYLRLESVGEDTIISVAPGTFTASIPIATIDNVIGVTLQQLLNNDLIA